jgi:hypothetical protein
VKAAATGGLRRLGICKTFVNAAQVSRKRFATRVRAPGSHLAGVSCIPQLGAPGMGTVVPWIFVPFLNNYKR